jgi:hypothetical protein
MVRTLVIVAALVVIAGATWYYAGMPGFVPDMATDTATDAAPAATPEAATAETPSTDAGSPVAP